MPNARDWRSSNQKPPGKGASFATKLQYDRKASPADEDSPWEDSPGLPRGPTMAAKPKAVETPSVIEQSSTPRVVKLRVVPKQVSVSWADMMDDDEEEDWANM